MDAIVIIDGPAIVHTITPRNGSTIDEYCELYIQHIKAFFENFSRIDVVFDVYIPFSLKEAVRTSRGVAPPVLVKGTTKIRSWLRFLKNDANKQSLFQPFEITPKMEALLERFVVLLYDRTSPCTSVNNLRKELFTRGRSIDSIPPTSGTLAQHILRTAYQGGCIWSYCYQKLLHLPDGWAKDK